MLIGTYLREQGYHTVYVDRGRTTRFLVIDERRLTPAGQLELSFVVSAHLTEQRAAKIGAAHVLSRGGLLGQDPFGLAGSPVAAPYARRMFDPRALPRFLHVPADSGREE